MTIVTTPTYTTSSWPTAPGMRRIRAPTATPTSIHRARCPALLSFILVVGLAAATASFSRSDGVELGPARNFFLRCLVSTHHNRLVIDRIPWFFWAINDAFAKQRPERDRKGISIDKFSQTGPPHFWGAMTKLTAKRRGRENKKGEVPSRVPAVHSFSFGAPSVCQSRVLHKKEEHKGEGNRNL